MKSIIGKFAAAATTVAALSLPQVAFGAYGDQGLLTMSSYANSGMSFSIASAARTGSVGVGGFSAVYDANGPAAPKSFVAFCIDLAQSFGWNSSFTVTETNPSSLFGAKASVLDRLYTQHYAEATINSTASKSAAFQLAVWEAITETPGGSYAANTGGFKVTGDTTTIQTAYNWLNTLTSASGGYTLTALVGPNNQDQMMATPVPEPQTYMMLLAGLGLMGFVARRRQRGLAA